MQQLCTTQVRTFFVCFLFLKETTKKKQCIITFFLCAKVKETHDETLFTEPNRGKRKGRGKRKKEIFFSHYLVSVKNRNSPVTFTLHF